MGGDPLCVLGFMRLGMRKFSMNPAAIAAIKRLVRTVDETQLRQATQAIDACVTAEELETALKNILANC